MVICVLIESQFAGVLMLAFGVWYLGWGANWIAWYRGGEIPRTTNSGTHIIAGLQVESSC